MSKDGRFLEIKRLMDGLERDYNLNKEEILDIFEGVTIPTLLFRNELSSFEIIVKYLIEEKGKSLSAVAKLTNRSKQGVSQAYSHAKKKRPKKIVVESSMYDFPLSIISDKKFSVLESIVKFLREEFHLQYSKIADILSRDQRTIWTVYDRVGKKLKGARRNK